MDCTEAAKPWQLVAFVLCILAILFTFFVLVSITKNWQNVRGKFVNIYATNVLAVSCIYSLIMLVDTATNLSLGLERQNRNYSEVNISTTDDLTEKFSGFITGFYFSLLLTHSSGILLLTYGARKWYLHQRIGKLLTVPARKESFQNNLQCTFQSLWDRRKIRAKALIAFSWIFTLSFAIPVPFGWKCVTSYACRDDAEYQVDGDCSNLWSPLKRAFVLTICVCSASAYVFAFGILIFTAKQHFHDLKRPTRNRAVVLTFCSLGATFRGCVILFVLSFASFLPQILISIVDSSLKHYASPDVVMVAADIIKLWTCLCILPQPVILIIYFNGIKTAVRHTIYMPCMDQFNSSPSVIRPHDVNTRMESGMGMHNFAFTEDSVQEVERLTLEN